MTAQPETLLDADERAWERAPASCDACGRTWLVAERELGERCGCGQGRLQPSTVRMPRNRPEQAVPVVVSVEGVVASLARHLARVRFRPKGMSAPDLGSRAVLVWWPRWMVDAWVRGAWGAEVGFDYEAHSTVEHYSGGSWVSKDQVDVRVRWEARTGTLERRYHNVVVPALRDEGPVARMGAADAEASPVQRLPDGRLLLPDQSPSEVWAAADEAFRARAADEVRRAAGGQHVRAVHLEPEFGELEWTVRLHPVWWTWYVDGDGVVRQLLVDGVSGRTRGPVMASTRQAWAWAAGIATAAVALLGLGLVVAVGGLLFPPALAVAALIGGLGVVVLAAALAPVVSVWSWNQRQRRI